jgi:hypothetical protein
MDLYAGEASCSIIQISYSESDLNDHFWPIIPLACPVTYEDKRFSERQVSARTRKFLMQAAVFSAKR